MPLPTPGTGETSQAFVSRCISFLAHENSAIPEGPARAAACYARLRKFRPGVAPKEEEVIDILAKTELDEALKQFEPPEAGPEAPQGLKAILKAVYNDCRSKWVKANPGDKENAANKTSCAKQAWGAAENAGWRKVKGTWSKKGPDPGLEFEVKPGISAEDLMPEDKFFPIPLPPANPSIMATQWPELEEIELPKQLCPSHVRNSLEELEELLNKP